MVAAKADIGVNACFVTKPFFEVSLKSYTVWIAFKTVGRASM